MSQRSSVLTGLLVMQARVTNPSGSHCSQCSRVSFRRPGTGENVSGLWRGVRSCQWPRARAMGASPSGTVLSLQLLHNDACTLHTHAHSTRMHTPHACTLTPHACTHTPHTCSKHILHMHVHTHTPHAHTLLTQHTRTHSQQSTLSKVHVRQTHARHRRTNRDT